MAQEVLKPNLLCISQIDMDIKNTSFGRWPAN